MIRKVAIACQGGGSHAAFAAGVLSRLLDAEHRGRFKLVALSGTSGGAMCASLVWRGLVGGLAGGGPDDAIRRLLGFWGDLRVRDAWDIAANFWTVTWAGSPVTFEVSPYAYVPLAAPILQELLVKYLDLDNAPGDRSSPQLFIGATDVMNGQRVIFDGEHLCYSEILASAAVPPLFRAVHTRRGDAYWDGLFATNPPVREFTDLDPSDRPDEIWVVQINPQTLEREPRTIGDIVDRRNELAGNLSLGQELYFVHKVNDLIKQHRPLLEKYMPIGVRVVEPSIKDLDYASKLDRGSHVIDRLIADGRERADFFFEDRSKWPREDSVPPKSLRVQLKSAAT